MIRRGWPITVGDVLAARDRWRSRRLAPEWRKLRAQPGERVTSTWAHVGGIPRGWWDVPEIQRRINVLVSGDETVGPEQFIAEALIKRTGLIGLSLGSGGGGRELKWMRTGLFASLTGYDISPDRVAAAQDLSRKEGWERVLSFVAADVRTLACPPASVDVVIAEGILHHLEDPTTVLGRVKEWLRPGGFLVVNEYVGPALFQWTERQMNVVREGLKLLPEDLRTDVFTGDVKRRVRRPGWLPMHWYDPSEAVGSEEVQPAVRSVFDVAWECPCGGAVLHPLLKNIAHHFAEDEPRSISALRSVIELESEAMASGLVGSDFWYCVAHS